jgi:SPP1 gp7 family putative phage head morphogenesis protein
LTPQEFKTLLRVNRARLPRRQKRVAQQHPGKVWKRYLRRVRRGMLADMWALVERHLLPELPRIAPGTRADAEEQAGEPDVGEIFDRIVDEFFERWTRRRFTKIVQPFGTQLATFHAAQLNEVLRELVGVDVVGSEPWLAKTLGLFTSRNVALIKTVPSIFFDEIEKLVTERIATGERWEALTEDLKKKHGASESHAKLIARDQSTKFYGALNKTRQEDLGIDGYHWRTMRDNRVRDEHETLQGERFSWDDPPSEGHPGQAIQCRCYADPDLQPLIDAARRETRVASERVVEQART